MQRDDLENFLLHDQFDHFKLSQPPLELCGYLSHFLKYFYKSVEIFREMIPQTWPVNVQDQIWIRVLSKIKLEMTPRIWERIHSSSEL